MSCLNITVILKEIREKKKVYSWRNYPEILIYQSEDGQTRIDVKLIDETVWLTQKLMAELFQITVPTINEHLKNLFNDMELQEEAVIRKFRTTASDGKSYLTNFYNLDAIISVGYRGGLVGVAH